MSKHLFRYRDLVRIHKQVTPARAPGPASEELVEILFLIANLIDDGIDAYQEATRLGPITVPRDLILDLGQRIFRLGEAVGLSVIDLARSLGIFGGDDRG